MKRDYTDQKIGFILRKYREESGFTQQELADWMGKSKPTISLWESGKRSINVVDFVKIIEILGCDTKKVSDELLDIVPPKRGK